VLCACGGVSVCLCVCSDITAVSYMSRLKKEAMITLLFYPLTITRKVYSPPLNKLISKIVLNHFLIFNHVLKYSVIKHIIKI
jgi:hypothetical protein